MVDSSFSNDFKLEWLKSIEDYLPAPAHVLATRSDEVINQILSQEGLPSLYTDLSGAPLHDRQAFNDWMVHNQNGASSSLGQFGRPVSGGNGSSDRDSSNLGQDNNYKDEDYNGLRIPTQPEVPIETSPYPIGGGMPMPPDRDVVQDDGTVSNEREEWFEEQNSTWFERIFGTSFQTLVSSIVSKYTDATVTGGEEIRNQWDLDKMNIANEFSAQQAEISRDWQEQMYQQYNSLSGKIHQAEQAGVNPMFAVTGNSVSPMSTSGGSPSGAVASGSGQKSGSDLLSSIASLIGLKSQIKKTEAETKAIETETDISLQKLSYELNNMQSSTNLNLQKVVESATSIEKMKADIGLTTKQAEVATEQIHYLIAQSNYINAIQEPEKRAKIAHATIMEWQEKNKELFKGLDIGMDAVSTLVDLGVGIFNAKTGRLLTDSPVVVPKGATVVKPSGIAF